MLAIVLNRRDFREFDQTVSLYTKEQGKVEALARGIKKITSKNAAALEPFSFVEVEIIRGKEVDHIAKVYLLESLAPVRAHLQKIIIAGYTVAVVDKSISANEKDERVYDLLEGFLQFLNATSSPSVFLIPAFLMKLYSLLGFEPVLDRCIYCGKDIVTSAFANFDLSGGGLVCTECVAAKRLPTEQVAAVALDALGGLKRAVYGTWDEVNELQLVKGAAEQLHELVFRFVVYHSNQKISDWRKMWIKFIDA